MWTKRASPESAKLPRSKSFVQPSPLLPSHLRAPNSGNAQDRLASVPDSNRTRRSVTGNLQKVQGFHSSRRRQEYEGNAMF